MPAEWEDTDVDNCPECGGSLQVFTTAGHGGCFDGDSVRCIDCGFRSGMSVDEDGRTWVQEA